MFVTTRRFKAHMEDMERRYSNLRDRYWALQHAHERLLQHLGLNEVERPRQVVLVEKDGPEPSET